MRKKLFEEVVDFPGGKQGRGGGFSSGDLGSMSHRSLLFFAQTEDNGPDEIVQYVLNNYVSKYMKPAKVFKSSSAIFNVPMVHISMEYKIGKKKIDVRVLVLYGESTVFPPMAWIKTEVFENGSTEVVADHKERYTGTLDQVLEQAFADRHNYPEYLRKTIWKDSNLREAETLDPIRLKNYREKKNGGPPPGGMKSIGQMNVSELWDLCMNSGTAGNDLFSDMHYYGTQKVSDYIVKSCLSRYVNFDVVTDHRLFIHHYVKIGLEKTIRIRNKPVDVYMHFDLFCQPNKGESRPETGFTFLFCTVDRESVYKEMKIPFESWTQTLDELLSTAMPEFKRQMPTVNKKWGITPQALHKLIWK